MLVTALVMFTLPAAAVMIYASLRPLWADSAHTDHAGLERTYRSIAIRAVVFVLALQALIVLNMIGLDWLRPKRAVVAGVILPLLIVMFGFDVNMLGARAALQHAAFGFVLSLIALEFLLRPERLPLTCSARPMGNLKALGRFT
jgi:hypothetical protein